MFTEIATRKHPERNLCVVLLSFSLGLRAQEIALLENQLSLDISEEETDPESRRSGRKSVRFNLNEFDDIVKLIANDARSKKTIEPTNYYPARPKKKGKSRVLAIVDPLLKQAFYNYTLVKLESQQKLYKKAPFIVSQKNGPYSPNTMQQLMAKIYRDWAGIKGASSHSGRRTFATTLLKKENESVKVVQALLGHRSAATTIIYEEEPSDAEKRDALAKGRIRS